MNKYIAIKMFEELADRHFGPNHTWRLVFSRSKRFLGFCDYNSRKIALSYYFVQLNDEDIVKNTILHEIAHALTPGHHHDYVWQRKCVEIGAEPDRTLDTSRFVSVPGTYVFACPSCKNKFNFYRKLKRSHYCRNCGPVFGRLVPV